MYRIKGRKIPITILWRYIMKKIRNILALTIAGVMVLGITGCGSTSATTNNNGTVAATDADGTAIKTAVDGKLVWATNAEFPPYEYHGTNGEVSGIDAEITAAIAEELGLEAQCEDMQFDSIIPAVTSGKADIGIAGMTITEDRLENVNFSTPYISAGQVAIVPDGSDITSVDDLTGKTIGVQLGTTGDTYVTTEIEGVTVDRYNKGFEAVQALTQGKVDAVVIDNEPAKSFVASGDGIKILDEPITEEQYAIAINKDNEALLNAVNDALAKMEESGKLNEIISKYIGDDAIEIEEDTASESESIDEAATEVTTAA
jgi:polar amino acid transport system substrate-binding protein